MTGRSLQQQIEDSFYSNNIQLDQSGFMGVDMNIITPRFDSFVVNAVARITFITKKDTIEIDHVINVSELHLTNLLQQGVKDAVPDMNVFIPRNHDLAKLEGGALWRRTVH
ncbi:hypothetical protein DPMN_138737 [Dreissena polymorpha]|uniref:Uncharacterized protein n=1 Tax=Dreissena polymorpha TaxID=45954 RepID=A0A9D4G4T1_DREPO|nr:hypothetical protein DPMN_138737 [Dreissena polymorpha]